MGMSVGMTRNFMINLVSVVMTRQFDASVWSQPMRIEIVRQIYNSLISTVCKFRPPFISKNPGSAQLEGSAFCNTKPYSHESKLSSQIVPRCFGERINFRRCRIVSLKHLLRADVETV